MNIKLGTAPDSWGVWFAQRADQIPWQRCLDEIAEAGYEWTELGPFGYLPSDVQVLKSELSRRNLRVSGGCAMAPMHDPKDWPELQAQVVGAGDMLAALGGKYLVLIDGTYSDLFTGELIGTRDLNDDQWKRLIDTAHTVAALAKKTFGLRAVFHPHVETHVEYEHQIERFLADTDPSLIALCLDTGHHAYHGGDPVALARKYKDRLKYLHLKSVDPVLRNKVRDEGIPFAKACAMGMFCEPSVGVVDFTAFRDVLKEINYEGFAIVEQDMYPCPFDQPLPIAKRTRKYLRELGIG